MNRERSYGAASLLLSMLFLFGWLVGAMNFPFGWMLVTVSGIAQLVLDVIQRLSIKQKLFSYYSDYFPSLIIAFVGVVGTYNHYK